MNTFTLATGRQVEKNATHCVAVRTRGRWNHQFFKSYKGANNEMRRLRSYSADTVAYYDIQEYKLIKPNV
jgi:hypothetical protein